MVDLESDNWDLGKIVDTLHLEPRGLEDPELGSGSEFKLRRGRTRLQVFPEQQVVKVIKPNVVVTLTGLNIKTLEGE